MEIPERVRDLVAQRQEARSARDFARADALRDEIAAAGFVVRDTPGGQELDIKPRFAALDPASIPNVLGESSTLDLSFHLLYEGFRDDVSRFLDGLAKHNDVSGVEVVLADPASADGEWLEDLDGAVRVVHLDRDPGWAAAHNAGLKGSRGHIVALADLSIEPTGDIVTPMLRAFEDPTVGVAGPFGLVSENMRLWADSPGPEVDAIEGYLLAVRREALAGEQICEKFRWYRNADIDLSFQVRAQGYGALVVPVPVAKHTHRAWSAVDEVERAKRSKRNHYVFFDRWKHREDLLLANRGVR